MLHDVSAAELLLLRMCILRQLSYLITCAALSSCRVEQHFNVGKKRIPALPHMFNG